MGQIEEKIKSLNINLPDPKSPVGLYVATKIVGKLLFISGQIAMCSELAAPKWPLLLPLLHHLAISSSPHITLQF